MPTIDSSSIPAFLSLPVLVRTLVVQLCFRPTPHFGQHSAFGALPDFLARFH